MGAAGPVWPVVGEIIQMSGLIGHTVIVVCPHCGETNYYDRSKFEEKLSNNEADTCVKCGLRYTMKAEKAE